MLGEDSGDVCGCLATVRGHSREVSVPFLVLSMVTVFWICESITSHVAFGVGAGSFENSELLLVVAVDDERPLYLYSFPETEVLDEVGLQTSENISCSTCRCPIWFPGMRASSLDGSSECVPSRIRTHSLLLLFSSTRLFSARMEIRNSQDAVIPVGSVKNSRPFSTVVDVGLSLCTTHRKPFSWLSLVCSRTQTLGGRVVLGQAGSLENSDQFPSLLNVQIRFLLWSAVTDLGTITSFRILLPWKRRFWSRCCWPSWRTQKFRPVLCCGWRWLTSVLVHVCTSRPCPECMCAKS